MKFTENLEKIEEILKKVENQETTLEGALAEFEKGVALIKECKLYLEKAQQKVTMLTESEENGEE